MKGNSSKTILFYSKLLILGFLVSFLVSKMSFDEIFKALLSTSPIFLIAIVFSWFVVLYINALKYKIQLKSVGLEIKLIESIRLTWVSLFINNFTPAGIGGEIYKFNQVSKKNPLSKNKIASISVFDKVANLILIFVTIVIFTPFYFFSITHLHLVAYIFLLICAFIIVYLFYSRGSFFFTFCPFKKKPKMLVYIGITFLRALKFRPSIIIVTYFLSGLIFFFSLLTYLSFFSSPKIGMSFFDVLCVIPLINLSEYFPLSLNSIGIRESTMLFLLNKFNVTINSIIVFNIVVRFVSIILSLLGGLLAIKLDAKTNKIYSL